MKQVVLEPNISVAGVAFGTAIEDYADRQHEHSDEVDGDPYEVYSFADAPVIAYVEDGRVETVRCDSECFWRGENLIGLDFARFKALYPEDADDSELGVPVVVGEDESEELQDVYDYFDVGLQVWVRDEKIVTILACVYEDEDEEDD